MARVHASHADDPGPDPATPIPWWARLRARADRMKERGKGRGAAYWALWSVPWATLVTLAWIGSGLRALWERTKAFFTEDLPSLPGRLRGSAVASVKELSSARGRAGLRRALYDEGGMTRRRRAAVMFLAATLLVAAWLLIELLTWLLWGELVTFKHETDLLLFYGIGTQLFLPTPIEILLLRSAAVIGAPTAVLVATIGYTIGGWLVFLVGSQANRGLEAWFERREWGRRFWGWLSRNAPRYGYFLMGVFMSIPFWPDIINTVFALLGLKMRYYLLTLFLATTLRLTLFLWLVA
ncbi:MAG: VTT domain-containing protein [Euryarchaeota archaeon]|nr:VTT domain-containing protein [Euryarchaeota archaeon]